jgi:hypothetical protein
LPFSVKLDSGFAGLAGHVLTTVQDYLNGERRMPVDLDGDVAPEAVGSI